jgi:K+-transporting ATPase KdpF subunit
MWERPRGYRMSKMSIDYIIVGTISAALLAYLLYCLLLPERL